MKKVIIIGCPGSGKSTFARKLKAITGLPLYHLDMMYWKEDKTIIDKELFIKKLKDTMNKPEWIIDGNYKSSMEMRIKACDTVFFLDYPTDVCLAGIESRKGKKRSDMPCVLDGEDKEFLNSIKNYNKDCRQEVLKMLEKNSDKNVIIFNTREESEEYLSHLRHHDEYTYYPMHMHLHAGCDYGSSMALYMYNAKKLGMEYIWFTDHDTRMGIRKNTVYDFSFDSDELTKGNDEFFCGFNTIDENTIYSIDKNKKALTLKVESDKNEWKSSGVYFVSKGTHHTYSLSGGVTLSVDVKDYNIDEDTRIIFAVKLSQRPPELKNAYMLYVMGNTEGLDGTHKQIIPVDYKKGEVVFPISSDVSERDDIGGKDNAFDTLYIVVQSKNGKSSEVVIGDFKINREKTGEELRRELQKTADKTGTKYGVTPFVSYELSGTGRHKNCFSLNVPVIEYCNTDYVTTDKEIIDYVKKYNGIFSYNHPFANKEFKGKSDIDEQLKLSMFKDLYSELFLRKAMGATLMEVGFPEGRNFHFDFYLYLWDMLSLSGVFLAGYGCNDCHRNNTWWFEGNNFAAFIGVNSKLSHPVGAEEFENAMKNRRMYTADPVKIKGNIDFKTSYGHPMGSVIPSCDAEEISIEFSAKNLMPGWEFRLIENGVQIYSEKITDSSYMHKSLLKSKSKGVSFQRAELWDETGRCILLTNPIYIADCEFIDK